MSGVELIKKLKITALGNASWVKKKMLLLQASIG